MLRANVIRNATPKIVEYTLVKVRDEGVTFFYNVNITFCTRLVDTMHRTLCNNIKHIYIKS